MASKKLIKFRLRFIFILSLITLTFFLSVYISGSGSPKYANSYNKLIANFEETTERFFERLDYDNNFDEYKDLFEIPETFDGYIPQGYCYYEEENVHIISYYHSEKSSIISVVNGDDGKKIKSLFLVDSNTEGINAHVGGIDTDNEFLYITIDKTVGRVPIDRILNSNEIDKVIIDEFIKLDVNCSYLNCVDEYLYVGEFYSADGDYETDKLHHIQTSPLTVSFARMNAYNLANIEFSDNPNGFATPQMSFAMPTRVQGLSRLNNGEFVLSISYGRKNYSYLKTYSDVTKNKADFYYDFNGEKIPVYFFNDDYLLNSKTLPPLLEGIDANNNVVTGIFESGAQKYSDAKWIENNICEF